MTRLTVILFTSLAVAADKPPFRFDPGPVETLDLAGGPGGAQNAPKGPFKFVQEESRGYSPKVIVTDGANRKWVVKFGQEVKAELFASRIAWAAGYPVRAAYYLAEGKIEGASSLKRAGTYIASDGAFREARFQMFDHEGLREIPGGQFNIQDRRDDVQGLNGLKLTLLLVANWDAKKPNTAIFEVDGKRYSVLSDWGGSMGDAASDDPAKHKWNCAAYDQRTTNLIDSVEDGYVLFNYEESFGRHERAISGNIRLEDLKSYIARMGKLTDMQLRSALMASGATNEEADCFTGAVRKRLDLFAAAARGEMTGTVRSRTVRKIIVK